MTNNLTPFEYTRLTNTRHDCYYKNPDFLKLNRYPEKLRFRDNKILYYYFQTGKTRKYTIKTLFTLNPTIFKLIQEEPQFTIEYEVVLDFLMMLYVTRNYQIDEILSKYTDDYIKKLCNLRTRSEYIIPDPIRYVGPHCCDNEFIANIIYNGVEHRNLISLTSDFFEYCINYVINRFLYESREYKLCS